LHPASSPAIIYRGGTLQTLLEQLARTNPRRFLFSGHADAPLSSGGGEKTLVFTGPRGELSTSEQDEVASALALYASPRGRLELVFLNGCNSYELGCKLIQAGVQCVVCWRTKVKDGAARVFVVAFFEELLRSSDTQRAFELAKVSLKAVMRDGQLPNGTPTQVQKYVLHDPALPSVKRDYSPAPISAGVPVLLPLPDEQDD